MRFATPVVALIAAALLAGCGSVAAPKPDPAGDAAFVTALQQLCSKTAPLAQINASASVATLTSAADADNTTVTNLEAGLQKLTPSLSSASPLAPAITNLAQMLVDTSKWYKLIVTPSQSGKLKESSGSPAGSAAARTNQVRSDSATATARTEQARADLAKIGVTSCLN
jgi:hypothetical protein